MTVRGIALTPQPDAVRAVRAATDAGMRAFTLTNGSTATSRAFLERTGVADAVDRVLSIDDVRVWKPAAVPYQHAVREPGRSRPGSRRCRSLVGYPRCQARPG